MVAPKRPIRAPEWGAWARPSAAEPQQPGEPVHHTASSLVVHDVHLNALGERILEGIVDPAVVVLSVREQRAHLTPPQRLEGRLAAVHGPARADALPHGLRGA